MIGLVVEMSFPAPKDDILFISGSMGGNTPHRNNMGNWFFHYKKGTRNDKSSRVISKESLLDHLPNLSNWRKSFSPFQRYGPVKVAHVISMGTWLDLHKSKSVGCRMLRFGYKIYEVYIYNILGDGSCVRVWTLITEVKHTPGQSRVGIKMFISL